jgi:ER lumen protein retaining receptor
LITFCLRYMDLFMYFVSAYNTLMKIFFITSTALIIYLIRFRKPFCTTYDANGDSFPHLKVLLPAAAVVTAFVHSGTSAWELVWSYSLWLESIAFIPQIIMLNKIREIENLTSHYVACLGLYRFFYILNW